MNKRFLAALSLMLVAIAVGACSGADETTTADGGAETRGRAARPVAQDEALHGEASGALASAETGAGGGDAYGDGDAYGAARRVAGLPDLGLSVIKTATVGLEVQDGDLQDTLQTATTTAEKYGGFVVSTSVSEDRDDPRGGIVIRIPAARFSDALADLESLGEVSSEQVSGQDVTQEFIDLQARLRNYAAQETVLLRLMERAQTVTDTIRVQNELQRVQLEIERLRGRITYLEDQTAMSTIELRVVEEGARVEPPGEFAQAWQRAKDALVAVVAGLISSLGVIVPVGVLALLVLFVVSRVRPRVTNT